MSHAFAYALVGAGLFLLGLYALVAYAHLLRKILALNIMGSGVFWYSWRWPNAQAMRRPIRYRMPW